METLKTWEERKAEARAQGWAEGLAEGRAEGGVEILLRVIEARGIDVPEEARARILAQRDPDALERMLRKALVVSSISDVLDAMG